MILKVEDQNLRVEIMQNFIMLSKEGYRNNEVFNYFPFLTWKAWDLQVQNIHLLFDSISVSVMLVEEVEPTQDQYATKEKWGNKEFIIAFLYYVQFEIRRTF